LTVLEGIQVVANLRSAIRDIRKSRKRAERNQSVKSAIKTFVKKTRTASATLSTRTPPTARSPVWRSA
jgi:ribosomal protein S20